MKPMKRKKPHVLVVEGDNGARDVLKKMLESDGYEVTAVADGMRGLEQLTKPDIHWDVITMHSIPRFGTTAITARDLLKQIRVRSDVSVILITGGVVDEQEILDAGFAAVIRKPVGRDDLLATIAKVIATK